MDKMQIKKIAFLLISIVSLNITAQPRVASIRLNGTEYFHRLIDCQDAGCDVCNQEQSGQLIGWHKCGYRRQRRPQTAPPSSEGLSTEGLLTPETIMEMSALRRYSQPTTFRPLQTIPEDEPIEFEN